jgi:predicted MPP superfamily phosphohydrolase
MFKKTGIAIVLIILVFIFLYYENNALVTTRLNLYLQDLPPSFDGYKILQLSDLHGKEFGIDNKKLVSKIKKASPNIIVITGDLINSTSYNEMIILNFIDKIVDICPVYLSTGNHEVNGMVDFASLEGKLIDRGVITLRNTSSLIHKNGDSILLIGLEDPKLLYKSQNKQNYNIMSEELEKLLYNADKNMFKILLSHRPEQFDLYSKHNINLTFSGHVHGGVFRLPFIGGLYAPNQGFFPRYDSGKYTLNNSTMVVSRGLGNGSIPQRIFNTPEIVVVTLKTTSN